MAGDDGLVAIPRLAERVGVTPRVLRYWEEQGLISPTREHGKLRYSPRDVAIARLIRRLLAAGIGIEGVRMLKRIAERDIRRSSPLVTRPRSPRRPCGSCTSARHSAKRQAWTRNTTPKANRRHGPRPTAPRTAPKRAARPSTGHRNKGQDHDPEHLIAVKSKQPARTAHPASDHPPRRAL